MVECMCVAEPEEGPCTKFLGLAVIYKEKLHTGVHTQGLINQNFFSPYAVFLFWMYVHF